MGAPTVDTNRRAGRTVAESSRVQGGAAGVAPAAPVVPHSVAGHWRVWHTHRKTDVKSKPDYQLSHWDDLSRGDMDGSFERFSLTRIQMFNFTVVVVGASVAAQLAMLTGRGQPTALYCSMVALLVLSHAGYITGKAVPAST